MTTVTEHATRPDRKGDGLLRVIGIFKLLKGAALIAAAISVFKLINKDLAEIITTWCRDLHIAPGNRFIARLLERSTTITARQLEIAGWVMLGYAAMFSTEGTGLLLLKPWAEWMTVITTSALIPFEAYEMWHKPTVLKAVAMAVNVIIAIYLVIRVKHDHSAKQ